MYAPNNIVKAVVMRFVFEDHWCYPFSWVSNTTILHGKRKSKWCDMTRELIKIILWTRFSFVIPTMHIKFKRTSVIKFMHLHFKYICHFRFGHFECFITLRLNKKNTKHNMYDISSIFKLLCKEVSTDKHKTGPDLVSNWYYTF